MREMEFLPPLYPQIRRRRRLVVLQGWITIVLVAGLGLWLFMAQRNVAAAEGTLSTLGAQLSQTDIELAKLDDLLQLQRQWRHQDQVINRLGLHVESMRILLMLSAVMPPEMALLDLSLAIEEQARLRTATTLTAARAGAEQSRPPDRTMKVKILGVAPTGVDLARFLTRLSEVPFLEQVAMAHLRDRSDSGHIMREFEVTFTMNLSSEGAQ